MANAMPGSQNKEEVIFDDFGEYDPRVHGTPTRSPLAPLQVESDNQATGSSGSLAISLTNEVARQLRAVMSEVRMTLEAKFDFLKRESEVNMKGRAYETGALATLTERVDNIEGSMHDLKNIKEIISDDNRTNDMIKKYKDFIIDGEAVE